MESKEDAVINNDFQVTAGTMLSFLLSASQVSSHLRETTYQIPLLEHAVLLAVTTTNRDLLLQCFIEFLQSDHL